MSTHDDARAERLARLYRLTGDMEDETRALVKGLLLAELGALEPAVAKAPAAPAAPAASGPPRAPAEIELRLRQLVEADAGWDRLGPLALALYQARRDPAAAARVVELAFLHGATSDVEPLVAKFRKEAKGFYQLMHTAVRAHLVARLWREGTAEPLATLLYRERDEPWLQPIERLFIFHSMAGSGDGRSAVDPATPYIYFRRWQDELVQAAEGIGVQVGLPAASFLLAVGRLAVDLGYDADARSLLERIPGDVPERDEALRLLLDVAVERNKMGRSHYVEMLVGQSSTEERLRLIGQFLAATRGLGGFKDRNRPALNEVLKDPLAWLDEDAGAWAGLSDLLAGCRDLAELLPNLQTVFRANALRFHAPLLDAALWQGPLHVNATVEDGSPWDQYWRGVALLHHYVTTGAAGEAALWEAKDLVYAARRGLPQPLPFMWKELHKSAFAWVARNHYVLEVDRQAMLRQLRVAVDTEAVALADLEDWVDHSEQPPLAVVRELQRVAGAKGSPALETRLILKHAQNTHLTNADLDRFWRLANDRNQSDLAWRVATVVNARQALCAPVRHAWEISGEKRALYPFQTPPKAVIDLCLKGFQGRAARLAYACLHVGPLLPELLAILDPGAAATRLPVSPPESVEGRVDRALALLPWLGAPKKRYRFSFESSATGAWGASVPAFAHVILPNPWSLVVARLGERLGINAWGWKLSRLATQIADLIPRLASRQDLRRHSGKVAGWLKDLTPEQRAAWQDLAALARALDDDKAAEALACFTCRLATAIVPNHYMALTSLQSMRAPVAVVWDLENWILSEAYSEVRKAMGTANRVLVPNALQRLGTLMVKS